MAGFVKRGSRAHTIQFIKSLLWTLFLLFVAFIAVRAAWNMYGKFSEAAESNERSQKELAALHEQQSLVKASVDSFASSRGLEAQVRERYGVVKPGEGQIQIVRDSASTTQSTSQDRNPLMRLWNALFGWI